jgi:RNA polymerase sigma-70 factor (ECF subfamily)
MQSTSLTLLQRVASRTDQAAWERFVDLYTPVLLFWARKSGLQNVDAEDAVQDILMHLLQELPKFEHNGVQRFRGWLHTVAQRKLCDRYRERQRKQIPRPQGLSSFAGPDDLAELCDDEYRRHLVASALGIMEAEFEPTTWRACYEHVTSGRSAAEIGRELGLSEGAVHVAKYRVLRRLRQELAGLLD